MITTSRRCHREKTERTAQMGRAPMSSAISPPAPGGVARLVAPRRALSGAARRHGRATHGAGEGWRTTSVRRLCGAFCFFPMTSREVVDSSITNLEGRQLEFILPRAGLRESGSSQPNHKTRSAAEKRDSSLVWDERVPDAYGSRAPTSSHTRLESLARAGSASCDLVAKIPDSREGSPFGRMNSSCSFAP